MLISSAIEKRLSALLAPAGFRPTDALRSEPVERLEYGHVGPPGPMVLSITHGVRHRVVIAELWRQPVSAEPPRVGAPESASRRRRAWQYARGENPEGLAADVVDVVAGWLADGARPAVASGYVAPARRAS